MQKRIDSYFISCRGELVRDDNGSPIFDRRGRPVLRGRKPPTITGLALALGFATRKSLLDYQAKAEFMNIITEAKLRVEEYAEEQLYSTNGYIGARFTLVQNFGWREQPANAPEGTAAATVNVICTVEK
jgi:hypothetical protein